MVAAEVGVVVVFATVESVGDRIGVHGVEGVDGTEEVPKERGVEVVVTESGVLVVSFVLCSEAFGERAVPIS